VRDFTSYIQRLVFSVLLYHFAPVYRGFTKEPLLFKIIFNGLANFFCVFLVLLVSCEWLYKQEDGQTNEGDPRRVYDILGEHKR
jgi:hypothetical protein